MSNKLPQCTYLRNVGHEGTTEEGRYVSEPGQGTSRDEDVVVLDL